MCVHAEDRQGGEGGGGGGAGGGGRGEAMHKECAMTRCKAVCCSCLPGLDAYKAYYILNA